MDENGYFVTRESSFTPGAWISYDTSRIVPESTYIVVELP